MQTGILDLKKWAEKAAEAVRRICHRKTGPCIGICLLFMELDDRGEKKWSFVIEMAGDPKEINNEERKRLEKAMEYCVAGMQKAYEGADEEISEFAVYGSFN